MNLEEQMSLLFVEEAGELLADFEQALLLLESLPDDVELLNRVFRCAHTLKGNSKILGFETVAQFTHELENLLDRLRKQELLVTQSVADTLLASFDVLKAMVSEVGGGAPHDASARHEASHRIAALVSEVDDALAPKAERPSLPAFDFESAAEPAAPAPTPAQLAEAPRAAREVPTLVPPVALAPVLPPVGPPAVTEPERKPTTPTSTFAAPPAPKERKGGEAESNSVRVPIEKLDRLINLTGEVVIAQSMIAQLATDLTPERVSQLQEVVAQMDRHCRELQERMLGARMLPIRQVFSRFNRLLRDLSASTGKQIALEVSGEETELDKTVIEKIADPLTHLVRNAVDHGIEPPDERRAAGKPEQARLTLSAYQKSGSIFIDVSDDGRGLNRQKILDKARAKGLVPQGVEPSDDEVNALIFEPGFSTAEQVTEISGRGVGMDVVKRNVEALRGSITIQTTPGQGTCFRIKLPLTLAILDGLGLRVGSEVYLVPLVAVVESLQPKPAEVVRIPGAGEVVSVRGEYLPLVRLYEFLGVEPSYTAPHEGLVMVVDDGSQRFAVQIDELLGQYQVVIKSLEANFQAVPGMAGATILADGRVALILDMTNLVTLARGAGARGPAAARLASGAHP